MNLDLREIPVVYINMDKDVDKRERIENHIDRLGFKTKIRVPGVVHEDGARAGCALAQYNALHEIDPPFIILEDDATPFDYDPIISIPDDTDALYLGISSWGRMNSHSGPFVQWDYYFKEVDINLLRVYNMLGTHAILYLNSEYISVCEKIAYHQHNINEHVDIGFTDVQKYYNVYAFDQPLFYQTSSNGTNQKLSSYPTQECLTYQRPFWLPTQIY
tara:strand:+ start:216 stop:866 length:651 start_codon:yes stop_codon:yes gene_type:complete